MKDAVLGGVVPRKAHGFPAEGPTVIEYGDVA